MSRYDTRFQRGQYRGLHARRDLRRAVLRTSDHLECDGMEVGKVLVRESFPLARVVVELEDPSIATTRRLVDVRV